MADKHVINMTLTEKQKAKLLKMAERQRLSQAEVVRDLIDEATVRGETRGTAPRTRRS